MSMNKFRLFLFILTFAAFLSVALFPSFAMEPLTFSQLNMNKEATLEKYKDDWSDTTIQTFYQSPYHFRYGSLIATITIPKMDIYELPIYYGADPVNNNWRITAAGHAGNWALFGETGVSCVGAHNYQLFKKLPSLEKGDKILIETSLDRYVYIVEETTIYDHTKDDWNKVATHHNNDYALNLMTCYPIDAVQTDDMYIVYTTFQKGTIFSQ